MDIVPLKSPHTVLGSLDRLEVKLPPHWELGQQSEPESTAEGFDLDVPNRAPKSGASCRSYSSKSVRCKILFLGRQGKRFLQSFSTKLSRIVSPIFDGRDALHTTEESDPIKRIAVPSKGFVSDPAW